MPPASQLASLIIGTRGQKANMGLAGCQCRSLFSPCRSKTARSLDDLDRCEDQGRNSAVKAASRPWIRLAPVPDQEAAPLTTRVPVIRQL